MFLGLSAGVWVVLVVGGLVGVALVAVLSKLSGKISDTGSLRIETVVGFLKSQENLLKTLLGDKYSPVYQTILDTLKSLVDKNLSQEEALTIVGDALDATLKVGNAELTEDQRKVVDAIIEAVVGMVVNEPVASARALSLM